MISRGENIKKKRTTTATEVSERQLVSRAEISTKRMLSSQVWYIETGNFVLIPLIRTVGIYCMLYEHSSFRFGLNTAMRVKIVEFIIIFGAIHERLFCRRHTVHVLLTQLLQWLETTSYSTETLGIPFFFMGSTLSAILESRYTRFSIMFLTTPSTSLPPLLYPRARAARWYTFKTTVAVRRPLICIVEPGRSDTSCLISGEYLGIE